MMLHEWRDLFSDILIILRLPPGTLRRMNVLIQPTPAIDAVDGKDLDKASINVMGDGADQAKSLVLLTIGGGGGKYKERLTPMTIHDNGHVLLQAWAVPVMIFFVQGSSLSGSAAFSLQVLQTKACATSATAWLV
jgi:hypothetical protein